MERVVRKEILKISDETKLLRRQEEIVAGPCLTKGRLPFGW